MFICPVTSSNFSLASSDFCLYSADVSAKASLDVEIKSIQITNIDIIFCATEKDFADQLAWVIFYFNFTDVEYAIIDDSPLCDSSYRYYRGKGSSNIQEWEKRNG